MKADTASSRRSSDEVLEPGVSVVVPVFNSETTLEELVLEVCEVLESGGRDFELILVNDGSADRSWARIESLARLFPRVIGIDLSRNFGQHNAKLCGLREARFDVAITMDDDLQHPPDQIPILLERLDEGWDVVYGVPKTRRHSRPRNVLTRATKSAIGRTTGLQRVVEQSPFRGLRTELRVAFADYAGPDVLLDVLLGWGTTRFCSVAVEHRPRSHGTTTYTKRKLFEMGILALTAYSTAPLRVASWLGVALTGVGICVLVYLASVRLFVGGVSGYALLASLVSIFSGTILAALGLLGEYLARVFDKAMGRPTYVIRDIAGSGAAGAREPEGD